MSFKLRPKHHMMLHVALDAEATLLNPKMWHNFAEESYLGKIKEIAGQCHATPMARRVMQKWTMTMANYLAGKSC